MQKKITMQHIADELGTSKVTVSRAINNKPGISDELRARILERAELYGYIVNPQNEKKIKAFAFLVPQQFFLDIDQFYTVIYVKLNQLCQSHGITLTAVTLTGEDEMSEPLPESLPHSYDGIFVAGECNDRVLRQIDGFRLPVVYIDFQKSGRNAVVADNYTLGSEIANFLLDCGHTEIGFVGDYRSNQNICDRYMGIQKAMIMRGLDYNPSFNVINNDFKTGLYTLNFTMPDPLPSTFVCTCDTAAYYLYEKLAAQGIRVPEDISVVSFDNTDICQKMTPALTSMDISKQEFAILAYELIHKMILNPGRSARKVYVKAELIRRESVKDRSNANG